MKAVSRFVARARLLTWAATLAFALTLTGCGHKEGNGKEEAHGKDDGHGHGEESPSGASFKENKGVTMTDETRKILGVEVVEVVEQKLPTQIRFNVQVFGEKHHHALRDNDHTGCDVHGSGFVPPDKATVIRSGQPVQIQSRTNESLAGVVLAVTPAPSLGETEVIVGLTNATERVKPGEFLSAVITLPRENVVTVIPRAALLRTAEGTFVYALNGDAYLRTAVKIGSEADGLLEITDGLLAGDSVVTKPVQTLYLIELRATKGGGHSH
jgi:hypothetical protein